MRMELTVKAGPNRHYFVLVGHRAKSLPELRLPIGFYSGVTLIFPQWEVEIARPVVPQGQTGKLNYHYSERDHKPYVCYPGSLPNFLKVMEKLQVWVVGQVCVLSLDRYLNEMIAEVGSPEAFVNWARDRHGIALEFVKLIHH